MFTNKQKSEIAAKVQEILKATGHPDLQDAEIKFSLLVLSTKPGSENHSTIWNGSSYAAEYDRNLRT